MKLDVALNNSFFRIDGTKVIIDHSVEQINRVSDMWSNSVLFDIGFNPITLISAGLTYKAIMSGYSKAAFYHTSASNLTPEERLLRMRNVRAFAIGAAPLIVGFLIVLAKIKPLASVNINTTVSVENSTGASFIGLGLFKSRTSRVLVLLVPIVVLLKIYFPEFFEILDLITLTTLIKFSLVWISLFVIYYGIQLFVAQSIVVSEKQTKLNLPKYLPRFIKNDYENLNIVIHQNKENTISFLMRMFSIYIGLLITVIILAVLYLN